MPLPPGSPPPKSNKLYQIELRSGDGLVDSQAVIVRIYVRSHGGESLAEIVRQDPAGLEYQPSHLLSTQEAVIGQGDYPAIVQDYFTGDLAKVQLVYLIREDEVIIVDIWAVNSATFTESEGELAGLLASLRLEATP